MKYTFEGIAPKGQTEVIASNEEDARHEAMLKRWGKNEWGEKYEGKGLTLIKVEQYIPPV